MPLINMQIGKKVNEAEKTDVQLAITNSISENLSKPLDAVMVSLRDNVDLFIGGESLLTGAYVEVKAFGHSSKEVKKSIVNQINKILEEELLIPASKIYITFDDKSEWGYKGNFLG